MKTTGTQPPESMLCQRKSGRASLAVMLRLAPALLLLLSWPGSAQGQVTSLIMTSDAGDYIGDGQFYHYSAADGAFNATKPYSGAVSVSFMSTDGSHWWYLDFAAPYGQTLVPGLYAGAKRSPAPMSNEPGLSVYGDGRGCNTSTGTFQIVEVTYGPDDAVASFDATFEQHCEGAAPALRGRVQYQANAVISFTAPSVQTAVPGTPVSFTVTASHRSSLHVNLSVVGLPAGANFIDNGNNTASFTWTPTSGQLGAYEVKFQGADAAGNTGVAYTLVKVIPPPPLNDEFDHATAVPFLPYTVSQNVINATTAGDDPWYYGNRIQSVWFAYTPTRDTRIEANTFGSNYDTVLCVYTGTRGALDPVSCNDTSAGGMQSRVRFDGKAGTTYYFMVSTYWVPADPASLVFNVLVGPPPFTFAAAAQQFSSVVPTTGAATVMGFVTCSSPSYVWISGQLKQTKANSSVEGYFSINTPCDGITPWSATVITTQMALFHGRSAALFTGGRATVGASAMATDPDTGDTRYLNLSAVINLRAKN